MGFGVIIRSPLVSLVPLVRRQDFLKTPGLGRRAGSFFEPSSLSRGSLRGQ